MKKLLPLVGLLALCLCAFTFVSCDIEPQEYTYVFTNNLFYNLDVVVQGGMPDSSFTLEKAGYATVGGKKTVKHKGKLKSGDIDVNVEGTQWKVFLATNPGCVIEIGSGTVTFYDSEADFSIKNKKGVNDE